MRHGLRLSTSIFALACASAAFTPALAADQIETVVVTAERRSEDLMKTPISADVLTGADLANKGVLKIDDLQFVSPGVTINNFGQGIDFNIRGIGKAEHNSQTMTGVITYRDNVPTFPGYITEEPYYDIASVQILRGPQGTFVGQNATGGAVFVTSNDPVIGGGYNGYAMASYGNFSDGSAQGAVNIPISDTLAIRLSGFGEARGSFFSVTDSDPADHCPNHKYDGCKPGYNPGDVRWAAGRVSVLWKPIDDLTVSFKYDADYLDNGAYHATPFQQGLKTLPPGVFAGQPFGGVNTHYDPDILHVTANAPSAALDRFQRAILKVDYVLPGGVTLRSVTGYQNASTIFLADLDATDYGAQNYAGNPNNWTFFDHVDETIYSQEVNLISPDGGRFNWVVGGFAQSDLYWFPPGNFYTGVPHGIVDSTLTGKNPQTSLAVFGQAGYKLRDDLEVQFGARYSYNRSKNNVLWNQFGTIVNQHEFTQSFAFTYKGSINWQIDQNNFTYAFISTGYKPGGLNPPIYTVAQPAPFGPEKVTEYEVGWKATLFDGHVRTTVDAYYNAYRNFIVTVAYPAFTAPIAGFATEVNDPHQTAVYGMEGELDAVFDKLSFGFGIGLSHSSLGSFFAVDGRVGNPFGAACNPATGPAFAPYCINVKGHPLSYAPSVSFDLNAAYEFDLDNGDKLTPRANFGHIGGQWASIFDNTFLGDRLEARNLLGAQLEWQTGNYVVTLYGTNLTDQHYEAALLPPIRYAGAPRQFGIRVMTAF